MFKKDEFLIIVSTAAIILSGTIIINNFKLEPSQVIQYNQAAEAEPGKTELTGELLSDFPSFPMYPGSIAKRSYRKEEGERVGYSVQWLVDDYDTVLEVMRWYTGKLIDQGWVILEDPDESVTMRELSAKAGLGDLVVYLAVEQEEEGGPAEVVIEFPLQRTGAYSPLNLNL